MKPKNLLYVISDAHQRRKIEELGGRDAVLGLVGDFGFTPIGE